MLLAHADVVSTLGVLMTLCVVGALGARGARRLRRNVRVRRMATFGAAVALVVLAVSPTIEHLAHERLAWHMTQHLILTVIAPPLFVLAGAGGLVRSGMPRRLHRATGPSLRAASRFRRRHRSEVVIAAALATVAAMWVWHVPALYDRAIAQPLLHGVEHATFFLTALLFWACALDRRTSPPHALLGAVLVVIAGAALGSILTVAPRPLFDSYAANPDALRDQQLAGLLMWIPGGIPVLLAAVAIAVRALSDGVGRGEWRSPALGARP